MILSPPREAVSHVAGRGPVQYVEAAFRLPEWAEMRVRCEPVVRVIGEVLNQFEDHRDIRGGERRLRCSAVEKFGYDSHPVAVVHRCNEVRSSQTGAEASEDLCF